MTVPRGLFSLKELLLVLDTEPRKYSNSMWFVFCDVADELALPEVVVEKITGNFS